MDERVLRYLPRGLSVGQDGTCVRGVVKGGAAKRIVVLLQPSQSPKLDANRRRYAFILIRAALLHFG